MLTNILAQSFKITYPKLKEVKQYIPQRTDRKQDKHYILINFCKQGCVIF